MGETKPYRSDKWYWHSIRDRYKPQPEWSQRNNVSLLSFVRYLCGPRYSFVQILKIASLILLAATCLLNLKLIMETSSKLENHQILLDFDKKDSVPVPFNDDDYFGHYQAVGGVGATSRESFEIKVRSSQHVVEVSINGEQAHYDDDEGYGRGMHITVVHESTVYASAHKIKFKTGSLNVLENTIGLPEKVADPCPAALCRLCSSLLELVEGDVMSQRVFDTFSMKQDNEMVKFLNSISSGRILVFAVKDEASFHLGKAAKEKLRELGSKLIDRIAWRSTWCMVSSAKGHNFGEEMKAANDENSWGKPVEITAEVNSVKSPNDVCMWPDEVGSSRRAIFCWKFDGYRELCRCDDPSPITFNTGKPLPASAIPVAVIASNRPQYLYRMLSTLLAVPGANPDKIVVFIDGQFEEPYQIGKLFGLKTYQHVPVGVKKARISQHYKSSLGGIFTLFRNADKAIIVEEDLEVSPDFFSYFSDTMRLLDEDSSIYCISAWNDQGYEHSCLDPTLLYRVETMPGLGWMLKRSLFENELEPKWPTQEKAWDWDMWMRSSAIRQDRECVIPDVSRTFHFGSSGVNMDNYFFEKYFENHAIYKNSAVAFKDIERMSQSSYERLMHSLIQNSVLLDHSKSPCHEEFVPADGKNVSYVAYFRMPNEISTDVFLEISKCLRIWDLDARGLHKSTLRTFIKKQHVVFIGYPASPYSLYKPVDVVPIFLKSPVANIGFNS